MSFSFLDVPFFFLIILLINFSYLSRFTEKIEKRTMISVARVRTSCYVLGQLASYLQLNYKSNPHTFLLHAWANY